MNVVFTLKRTASKIEHRNDNAIVKKIYFVITFVAIALLFLSQGLLNFKLDSSSDALVLQGDESFKIYREVGNTFGNSDFLIITFTPNDKLFSKNTLETISTVSYTHLRAHET